MRRSTSQTLSRGVSLIELMVGMVIGLLATLVISQVAVVFESQKRATTTGSDAQVNGALALSTLQRDIMASGFGITMGGAAGCTIKGKYSGNWQPERVLAPVLITQGSSGAPDSIRVLASSNTQFSLPIRVYENHLRGGDNFVLDDRTNVGNRGPDTTVTPNYPGDLMLAVPNASGTGQVSPNWCSLFNISDTPSGNIIRHDTDVAANGKWNQDSTATMFPGSSSTDVSYSAGSYLINLGTLTDRCYFVSGSSASYQPCGLTAVDSTETTASYVLRARRFISTDASTTKEELYPGIVNLQAVYGLDTDADRAVNSWTPTTPTTAAVWAQVIAVRVVIVVRSDKYEQCDTSATTPPNICPTRAQPSWKPDGNTVETLVINTITDWQHYRYRVYEAVIPLRNMIWQS